MKAKKFENMAKIGLGYKSKNIKLKYHPLRLWIEPTNHCNLKCIMCPNKDFKKHQKGYMDFGLYKKIIDEISEFAFDVNLNHRGESLLHKDFCRMVAYAKEKNLITKLHTNATLLTQELSKSLIESGLDMISFSFDAFDKESYEKIRVNAKYEQTIKNIRSFLKEKKGKKPYTQIELIKLNGIVHKFDLKKIKNTLNLHPDKYVIKEMHNWGGNISSKFKSKDFVRCTFPWYSLTIFWDGTVVPCPQDWFGDYALGNANENTITEIWDGKKIIGLRNEMNNKELKKPCKNCDRIWRKRILGIPKEYLGVFLNDNLIKYKK